MRTNMIVCEINDKYGNIANYAKTLGYSKQYLYRMLTQMEQGTCSVKAQNKILNPLGWEVVEITKTKLRKVK